MTNVGNFYLFNPPFSETEHFVEVTDVKNSQTQQGEVQYVYYKHVMSDVDGSVERSHFENGSYHLTLEGIEKIINGINSQIEDLEEKRDKFTRLREVVAERLKERPAPKHKPKTKAVELDESGENGYTVNELVSTDG